MQIQLTQDELKDAVRQYVAKDFNLEGRTLTISFTATRGDAGIVTNLSISKDGDVVIPGYTNSAPDAPAAGAQTKGSQEATEQSTSASAGDNLAAVAPVVASDTATTAAAVAKTEAPEVAVQEEVVTQGQAAEVAEAVVETPAATETPAAAAPAAEAKPATTTSLFG